MLRRMISEVTSVFSRSGFDSYVSGIQAHDGLVAHIEHEARKDYANMVRAHSSLPW
ncbi:MAG: hypothetical protein Q8P50_04955 [Bacillota bacterium]|nr:hypothetical protein [Bacillota bacterium]